MLYATMHLYEYCVRINIRWYSFICHGVNLSSTKGPLEPHAKVFCKSARADPRVLHSFVENINLFFSPTGFPLTTNLNVQYLLIFYIFRKKK